MFLHLRHRGRAGIPTATMPTLREAKQVMKRHHSKLTGTDYHHRQPGENLTESWINNDKNDHQESSTTWVPHPRTGIYFPEGKEWVMADVPKTAASFDRTFWLRNDDGVEKLDSDDALHTRF
ncbi:hypothetical protein ACOSP7_005074 [Xanthoceras sorbifolium]|uniref:Late embryogenesis abundant protein n=1 Tax=Xanthoceras sorbifolium TaxID=99658 RepID=A0ABQ8IFU0_9ROSI|nr:hypothetical protein JRO89_XS02G0094200 [Xanthoceras sorbifolium]